MVWKSSSDAMPWVGLYVCLASIICTLAMAADAFQSFRQRKLWFPCRFFTINAASLTLISIAMKLPVDLSTDLSDDLVTNAKFVGIIFLVTMLANFLPSLSLMNDKELGMNTLALGILIITTIVNVLIQLCTSPPHYIMSAEILIMIFSLPWPFSVALMVSASRKILQHRYKELHGLASHHQEMNFSRKRLKHNVKKYWMMAETGNPQFAIACSPVSSAFGVLCTFCSCILVIELIAMFSDKSRFDYGKSDYKWSIKLIIIVQSVGSVVGSIAPIFRCLTATTHFDLSTKWSRNHLNVFRVEKHWIQMLQLWKRSHVPSYIPGCHCKKVFRNARYVILSICIAFQITVSVICNTTCLLPRSLLILLSSCYYYFCNSLLKRSTGEPDASNNNMRSEMEEYYGYVLQIEVEPKLSNRILGNTLNSITRLLHESKKKEPRNLLKLLKKSKGFYGVLEFDNDQDPNSKQQNCWSLVTVTLTAIALALPLPKIPNNSREGMLASMREALQLVRHIEQSLNANDELVKARKAAGRVWTDVEVYCMWLQIDLQEKARRGGTSEEILQWLGAEAMQIVTQFLSSKNGIRDLSLRKLIAASSMYRISRTILLHCSEQKNWPTDEELFARIATIIADLLCACFTNLPRVITMKCHEDVIEKREHSIRTAAQLLGKSKKILKILETRQLPNLDLDSIAYIDQWHALPTNQIPNVSTGIQPASPNSNEPFIVTII